ncbi:Shedu anti-phage system protein SduA domain-containing protein [Nodularia sp. UHCC 0506]|uniref:Shedu anti-phage system protein SduA domain-containing protein n=1 Tax=Nodularia sp. UHCC 0506 TaxID=3110243 RepID=UPI002B21DE48|nr:Shedu anti-phage system protein SduA domain-containing protein [Nodularia sp. UHCC 0506]MEA5512769.1 Shedu anti-phage system protein SduA domain-containing protein [Nodularia sp. UHCC 0506]
MFSDLDLWNAIYALYELLVDQENSEAKYQYFFESNPVVFKILGFDTVQSYEKSSGKQIPFDNERGFRPEPDFLCANLESCNLTVFELKTPFVSPFIVERTDGNRRKFNATAESYVSQATEYIDSIRERSEARNVVKSDLLLPEISSYKIILIYGLAEDNDMGGVSRLLENRKTPTSFICYDSLLNQLIEKYLSTRKPTDNRIGGSIIYHLIVDKEQLFTRSFIADHGSPQKNRLSIFIENGYIIYQCIDNEYIVHLCKAPITYEKSIYLRFEYATDHNGIYMSLNVNNEEHDLRIGSATLNFNLQLTGFVLGTDISCKYFGKFYMLEACYVSKTMSIEDKLGSYHYFKRKAASLSGGVYFDGAHYLVRNNNGNMSQSDPKYQPKYVKPFLYEDAPVSN